MDFGRFLWFYFLKNVHQFINIHSALNINTGRMVDDDLMKCILNYF